MGCSMLTPYAEEIIEIINVDSNVIGPLLIIYSAFIKYLRKKQEYNIAVHQLFIDFKQSYDSFRREAFYSILVESGIPMKPVRLIKMCLKHIEESK